MLGQPTAGSHRLFVLLLVAVACNSTVAPSAAPSSTPPPTTAAPATINAPTATAPSSHEPSATSAAPASVAASAAATPTLPETPPPATVGPAGGRDPACGDGPTADIGLVGGASTDFTLRPLDWDLSQPVYLAGLPGTDRVLIVERAGVVREATGGALSPEPLLDISSEVSTTIEDGFHSVALHPDFATNGRFFAFYNDKAGDVRVTEFVQTDSGVDTADRGDLLHLDKPDGVHWHNGGQLQFGPDGLLYVGVGDAARNPLDPLPNPHPDVADPHNHAQDESLPWGKILRLDVDSPAGEYDIAAVGLRNPWRFSFDAETNDLFIGDVGQHRWEEIDLLPATFEGVANFGWSICEGVMRYKDGAVTGPGEVVAPIAVYRHPDARYCADRGTVVGGVAYRGSAVPALAGRYLAGDFCTGELWTLTLDGGVVVDATLSSASLRQIVSFGVDGLGEAYAISVSAGIHRIVAPGE